MVVSRDNEKIMTGRGRLASTLALAVGLALGLAVANAEDKVAKLDGVLGITARTRCSVGTVPIPQA
jgi:hypothetical protein